MLTAFSETLADLLEPLCHDISGTRYNVIDTRYHVNDTY